MNRGGRPVSNRAINLSIATKLYWVIGTMAVLIVCELLTVNFAMNTLSAVRATVAGEGSWSKAQKDAAISLSRYTRTFDEAEYGHFIESLRIPEGDHLARTELFKPHPDLAVVRQGFLQGEVAPDDLDGVISLLRRFRDVSYLARAIEVWNRGDELLEELKGIGVRLHERISAGERDSARLDSLLLRFRAVNRDLTRLQTEFSAVLGAGSRWLERVVLTLLFLVVLTVETVGLTLTFRTTRALSRGLREVHAAAVRIGQGDFNIQFPVRSRDELGQIVEEINRMGGLLESSYRGLEARVAQRTAELEAMALENARLYEQATAAVVQRDEFLSIASHELKTPLTALILQMQLLAQQSRDAAPQIARRVESCLRQSLRLAALSTELMDLTQIRLGKLELRREAGDLAAIVRDVALQLGPEAARAESALELRASAPVLGVFDPTRIGQVATNLISNAIKYGNGQPISVAVSKQGAQALIEVRDRGMGITAAEQERVFERFERGEEGSAKAQGLGLGLYVSRQIVERHGGTISVESEPGVGSTFKVELPLSG